MEKIVIAVIAIAALLVISLGIWGLFHPYTKDVEDEKTKKLL